jgi:hypothetical protein
MTPRDVILRERSDRRIALDAGTRAGFFAALRMTDWEFGDS